LSGPKSRIGGRFHRGRRSGLGQGSLAGGLVRRPGQVILVILGPLRRFAGRRARRALRRALALLLLLGTEAGPDCRIGRRRGGQLPDNRQPLRIDSRGVYFIRDAPRPSPGNWRPCQGRVCLPDPHTGRWDADRCDQAWRLGRDGGGGGVPAVWPGPRRPRPPRGRAATEGADLAACSRKKGRRRREVVGCQPIGQGGTGAFRPWRRDDITIPVQLWIDGHRLGLGHGDLDFLRNTDLHGTLGQLTVEVERVQRGLAALVGIRRGRPGRVIAGFVRDPGCVLG